MDAYTLPLKPCLDCGQTCRGPRCPQCRSAKARAVRALDGPGPSTTAIGYDAAWRRLSLRARREQPWCSHCGTSDDLTLDHSPEAWVAHIEGRTITPDMVQVLCRSCNARKGAARSLTQGGNPRRKDTGAPGIQGLSDTHVNPRRPGARRRRVS
jgi:5-methylcytosine-specific restriction protein A